ncbi:7-cyano-7-deazaguanine synthase QueC [Formicincola oecophyllae]|uniref:7-cyano-7-deazaguanine synthase n=1 Tax=Formicincola oecophyllae TaxID=2558361 RepID=A0A4Y6U8Q6_9PROT|nr:7-cyano-7-deazaguanine synthase QueC [Formicincola oecophyllae]QDH13380.1 7-cyano-7-deazaguanine synthase QueC [Formicincola oecophyllae]
MTNHQDFPVPHTSRQLAPLSGSFSLPGGAALVLFSGGQDSATCLAWALSAFQHVETVGFSYGQRHAVEMDCRATLRRQIADLVPRGAERLGDDHVIDLPALGKLSETALTRDAEIKLGKNGLPNTFVPGRNLIFLTFAAALAFRRNARTIITGVCETDYSGYPDCRDDAIKAMQVALNIGMDQRFVLQAPLMWLDKARTWKLAELIGGPALVETIRRDSHSCYHGDRGEGSEHDWGYGCGHCPACELRAEGWHRYQASKS